jgi:sugar phosphate isomerase/epimerase
MNMKISFMTFACPTLSFDEVVALAVRHAYQGIEFRSDAGHKHGVELAATAEQRSLYRHKLVEAGVEACCLATSLQFVNKTAVDQAPALIDLAADLGCPALRVFCGPLPAGLEIDNAVPVVANNLRRVVERALYSGVKLWLETHDSISKSVYAGRIVRLVDHPALAINWDNMHPYRNGESLATTWQAIAPFIQHTHFHDALNDPGAPVITPFGQGQLPIQAMFNLLRQANYQGYYSGEWFDTQMGADADASLEAHKLGLIQLEQVQP